MQVAVDLPIIEVLLATYNGEAFLREQVASILAQRDVTLRILARDDGSCDRTVDLLKELAAHNPAVMTVLEGAPTGQAKLNFLTLMRASSATYVSLSDQDDVWLPNKLSQSIAAMKVLEAQHGKQTPLLVFSDLRVVDRDLKELFPSFWKRESIDPEAIHSLNRMLVQNVVTGCTALMNRALLVLALDMPPEVPMHDRWITLLASSAGHAAYVPSPTVLYRQHGGNVVGANLETDTLTSMAARASQPSGRAAQWAISQQLAAALLRKEDLRLSPHNRFIVETFLRCGHDPDPLVRLGILLRYRFFRTGFLRNLATMALLWKTL